MVGVRPAHPVELVGAGGDRPGGCERAARDVHPVTGATADPDQPGGDAVGIGLVHGGHERDDGGAHGHYAT